MFKTNESILLDRNAIRPNAAKRPLAKLCLNSMWGKLTERNHHPRTELISNPQELYRFLATPGIDIVNLLFASDHVVFVSWKYAVEERIPNLPHTNEVIGHLLQQALESISMLISTSSRESNLHRYRLCHIRTKGRRAPSY